MSKKVDQSRTIVNNSDKSRGGAWGAPGPPPLFFDQNEAQSAEKSLYGGRPFALSQGLDDRGPPPLSEGLDIQGLRFCILVHVFPVNLNGTTKKVVQCLISTSQVNDS